MDEPDVLEGAIRIARVEYPGLDAAAVRTRLDELAEEARPAVRGRKGGDAARGLLETFAGPLGFHGNREDYGDPRNSYVNDVLERRTGIPISLCWVYVELARRLGLRADGVGFPGHFLARAGGAESVVVLDCFNGIAIDEPGCLELLASAAPGAPPDRLDEFLAPAPSRAVLFRMLANLRRIHEERGDFSRVLAWLDLLVEFGDRSPELARDRGFLRFQAGSPGSAIDELERYLRLSPQAADGDAVRDRLTLARQLLTEMN